MNDDGGNPAAGNPVPGDSIDNDSVTDWFQAVRDGDDAAAGKLWNEFFEQLVGVARHKLQGKRRVRDEEDVALSVLDTVFRGAAEGRFQNLAGREELWRLLVTITAQKSVDALRSEGRQKRGGGQVRGHSIFGATKEDGLGDFDQVIDQAGTDKFISTLENEHERLFQLLRDESLRQIAQLRMEGYENKEIAEKLEISNRSVERKLKLIRDTWTDQLDGD